MMFPSIPSTFLGLESSMRGNPLFHAYLGSMKFLLDPELIRTSSVVPSMLMRILGFVLIPLHVKALVPSDTGTEELIENPFSSLNLCPPSPFPSWQFPSLALL